MGLNLASSMQTSAGLKSFDGASTGCHSAVMLVMMDLDNTLADRAGAVDAWISEFVAAMEGTF